MTSATSVREKALLLQNEVRRLEAGTQGEGQAKRIARRVAEIQAALGELSGRARAARALQRYTTAATVSLDGLDAGRDDLVRRAAGSVPSDNAFVAARRKIEARTSRLAEAIQAAWKPWAEEQLAALPVRRIAMLASARQAPARAGLKRLRDLAAAANVTASDIAEFVSTYAGLNEELGEAQDVPEALLGLIDRLWHGGVLLSDVSDEEIALLRASGLDAEIELRRKSP